MGSYFKTNMLYQILEDGDQYGLMLCGFATINEAETYFEDRIEENSQLYNKNEVDYRRRILINYEIKMRSCSDEQAEKMVDSYLASTEI